MKLLTLDHDGSFHPAIMIGTEVLDLAHAGAAIPDAKTLPPTLRAMLASGTEGLATLARIAAAAQDAATATRLRQAGALRPFAEAKLAPVVPDPRLMLSGSMNSRGHLEEMHDPLPAEPCAFLKVPSALGASGDTVAPPPGHDHMLDWEGEFCVVIGTRCHRVTPEQAPAHIFGYTLTNDISAREFVPPFVTAKGAAETAQAWERNVLGKNFPGFAPIGPVIATADEFPNPLTYHLETVVNGQVMQTSTQEDLVFTPAQMIAYFSEFYVFEPGDIVSMGSPPGVGFARRPQIFLKPGDLVEVRCPQIGALVSRIGGA